MRTGPTRAARSGDRAPWSWLADPRGIGWPLALMLVALAIVDGIVTFGQVGTTSGGGPDRTGSPGVAGAMVGPFLAVLLVARWGWLGSGVARRRPGVMLGSVVLAAAAAALGAPLALRLSDLLVDPTGPSRVGEPLLVGDVAGPALLLVAATSVLLILLGALNEHRDALARLRVARVTLEDTLAASTVELAAERARLEERVRGLVEVGLGRHLDAPGAQLGTALQQLARSVLRPLSHELARGAPGFGPIAPPRALREPWRRALGGLTVPPDVRPVILALSATILAVSRSFAAPPPDVAGTSAPGAGGGVTVSVDVASLAVSLSLLVTTFFVTLLLSRTLGRRLAARPAATLAGRWVRALLGLVGAGVAVVAGAWSLHAVFGLLLPDIAALPPIDGVVILANVLPLVLVTLAVSLTSGARTALRRHRADLALHNEDLRIAVVRTNALLAKERRDVARALHGSVQAAVQAAGIRLDRAARDGSLDEATLDAAIGPIRRSLDGLGPSTVRRIDLAAELAATRATWEGVCTIAIVVDPRVRGRLETDALAGPVLLDLVREACANAVVHGAARRIDVSVAPEGAREVLLRVRDDGASTHPLRSAGLGSEVLDTSCSRWHLERDGSGTELVAVLPLG